jgi:hypothetical protein
MQDRHKADRSPSKAPPISPSLKHIKLDKKQAEQFPELQQVLKCHSQSTDYMIQLFKKAVVKNCTCKACTPGIMKLARMSRAVYDKVMELPMPMPILKPAGLLDKPEDLQYLSFADAHKLPFTNKYQPSLEVIALRLAVAQKKKANDRAIRGSRFASSINVTKLKNKASFKIGIASKVRGVVQCNNCSKPRCIYSLSALSHMRPPPPPLNPDNATTLEAPPVTPEEVRQYMAMARGKLQDALESPIYICGMAPLDLDDPCYEIFLCGTTLDCDKHVESKFYVSKVQPTRLELCCYCAGEFNSPIELNTSLKAHDGPYSVVLPICKACLDNGYSIIVRAARQNANAKQAKIDADRAREALREEVHTGRAAILPEEASEGASTTSTAEQVQGQQYQAVEVHPPPKKRDIRFARGRYVIF